LDDNDLFIPEEVTEHRISSDGKSMDLKVKWIGNRSPEWTGLNMSLKRNEIVQKYLGIHNLIEKFGIKQKATEQIGNTKPDKRVRFNPSLDDKSMEHTS
jgi:hypothetical protein